MQSAQATLFGEVGHVEIGAHHRVGNTTLAPSLRCLGTNPKKASCRIDVAGSQRTKLIAAQRAVVCEGKHQPAHRLTGRFGQQCEPLGLIRNPGQLALHGNQSSLSNTPAAENSTRRVLHRCGRHPQSDPSLEAVRERILQWTGIPCGIGIGITKTLAKLANHVAKSADCKPGNYPVEFARADKLETSLDVARLDPATVRRRWSVVLERTVRELQGQPCVGFETVAAAKKEIACTRSFGHPIEQLKNLIEAVTDFCSRAAEKLRKQNGHAVQVLVFIHTSPFRLQGRQYSQSVIVPLRRPTADTALIAASAIRGLKAIFKPGYKYAKAGVMLLDLLDARVEQGELDFDDPGRDRGPLMSALDAINQQHARGAIQLDSAGMAGAKRQWVMRQSLKTPNYTTSWADLPLARA